MPMNHVQASTRSLSDKQILDRIEGFLGNHFRKDERRELRDSDAIAVLEHIESLVQLRQSGGSMYALSIGNS